MTICVGLLLIEQFKYRVRKPSNNNHHLLQKHRHRYQTTSTIYVKTGKGVTLFWTQSSSCTKCRVNSCKAKILQLLLRREQS